MVDFDQLCCMAWLTWSTIGSGRGMELLLMLKKEGFVASKVENETRLSSDVA